MLPDRDTIIAEPTARLAGLARGLGRDAAAIGKQGVSDGRPARQSRPACGRRQVR